MKSIPVIWWEASRGNWDSGLLCEIFEKHPQVFIQHNEKELIYPDRAIIIVVGKPDVQPLRLYLETFKSGIVILTSDEDSYFDWKAAIPEHLEIWTQYFAPNKSEIKERLLLGPPNRLKNYKINKHLPKKYLWSFVGQVQNPFRQACVEVLKTLPDGYLQICSMFGGEGDNGMEYQQYLDIMCQSKYVICPAGSMCVDSFRLYEAMECGAIPITDIRAPRDTPNFNYWLEVYPEERLSCVRNWKDLPEEIEMMPLTHKIPELKNSWYSGYKHQLENKLLYEAAI